jgi:hypothetical protein
MMLLAAKAFQVSLVFFCGSGFPAAMIEAERISHKSGIFLDCLIELKLAVDAARASGELLLKEFNRPGGPRGRGGHCPADEEAEALIRFIGRQRSQERTPMGRPPVDLPADEGRRPRPQAFWPVDCLILAKRLAWQEAAGC